MFEHKAKDSKPQSATDHEVFGPPSLDAELRVLVDAFETGMRDQIILNAEERAELHQACRRHAKNT
jgi:hypothetical protein